MSRRTTQVLSAVVVALLVVATWWLQEQGTGEAERQPRAQTSATSGAGEAAGIPSVALDDLPPEAAETVERIDAGGPFPYPGKDGSTFGNFEGLLRERARGYYAEYTVPTPGEDDRGARRIVAGDGGELYWTADHYESFERIVR